MSVLGNFARIGAGERDKREPEMAFNSESDTIQFRRWTWFLSTTISWGLGWALALTLLGEIPDDLMPTSPTLSFLMVPATAGGVIGLGQWLTLRRFLKGAWKWIPATTVGTVLAAVALIFGLLLATGELGGGFAQNPAAGMEAWVVPFLIGGTMAGALAGMSQWLVLRPHSQARALLLLALVFGWSVGLAIMGIGLLWAIFMAASDVSTDFTVLGAVSGTIGGAIVGIVTGIPLAGRLRPR
ncbi:MAG: hypothetical protein BMS9Abin28_1478 [Anaerolineae bacterium]|nr:MAG: hypothetical protein BMS9Abin28_1478 [Anaerolineae bacterium]